MRSLSPVVAILVGTVIVGTAPRAQEEPSWQAVALRAALQALDSSDPKTIAHGIDALVALEEPDIARVGAAYRKSRADRHVRSSTIDALTKLRSHPDEAVPILIDLLAYVTNPANKDPNTLGDQDQSPFVQAALTSYGAQAGLALPSLIALFVAETGPFRHGNAELSKSIAAIGLRSEADVDAVVRAYTTPDPPWRDELDALNGIPRAQRGRAAEVFLPLTHLREGDRATDLATQSIRALGVLAVASPAIVSRLEAIVRSDDAGVSAGAASSLSAILAANPGIASEVLERRIYSQNRDLVDVVAQLAGEEGPQANGFSFDFNGETNTSMRTLARLSQVSPRAREILSAFLQRRRPAADARTNMIGQGLAIAALPWAGDQAAALLLATLPLGDDSGGFRAAASPQPSEGDATYDNDLEVKLQAQLAATVSNLGLQLVPAFRRVLSALDTSKNVNDRRMLAWSILQMVDGGVPFVGEIASAAQRMSDSEARAYLLAAYLRGGGEPVRVIDDVKQLVTETSPERIALFTFTWQGSGDSELFDAIVRRSDFNWNSHQSGTTILNVLIQARTADDIVVHNPADLVPFGPLSLSQALLLLEGRAEEAYYLEDPSFWAPFLAPSYRSELSLAEQHLIGEPPGLPDELGALRARFATLTRILDASSPTGKIQYAVAPALAQVYGRGVGQWTRDDARLLADAAAALERFASPPAAASTDLNEEEASVALQLRSDAVRNARVVRDRIAAEDLRAKAEERAITVERDTAVQLQSGERARKRAVFASIGFGGALLAVSIIVVSASVRRRILILAGRRWSFVTAPCDGTLEVTGANAIFRPTTGPRPVVAAIPSSLWPPSATKLSLLKTGFQAGWNIRVLVDESQFRRPWSHLVGSPWSEGKNAVVAGQLCVAAPEAVPPAPLAKSVVFASYACAVSPGQPTLDGVDGEAQIVDRLFSRWGAMSRTISQASVQDVIEGLATADVVHVAAHATGKAIHLSDGSLDVERLGAIAGSPLRCRLLVLSCCEAGRIEEDQSFVYYLVRAGVNVLAARNPVADQACVEFFEAFYRALLPARRAQGIDLGTCIRGAADACTTRFRSVEDGPSRERQYAHWKETVDSFMLYGDPSTQLKLVADSHRRVAH